MHFLVSDRYRAEVAATRLKAANIDAYAPQPRLEGENIVQVTIEESQAERVLAIIRQVDPGAQPLN